MTMTLAIVPTSASTARVKLLFERSLTAGRRKAELYAALFASASEGREAANQPLLCLGDGVVQRPVFVAITFCWPEALFALLGAGADPNVHEEFNVLFPLSGSMSTALMAASGTCGKDGFGQTTMVEALLAARADVDKIVAAPQRAMRAPESLLLKRVRIEGLVSRPELNGELAKCVALDEATGRCLILLDSMMRKAFERGVAPMDVDVAPMSLKAANLIVIDDSCEEESEDETPLAIAANCGDTHIGVVRVLLAAGASVASTDNFGASALHGACTAGASEVVSALLGANAQVNARTACGWTPLHSSASEGHSGVLNVLIAARADLHATNNHGYSPLYAATEGGDCATVSAMLAAGATVNQPTDDGRTPLFCAAYSGASEVVAILLAARASVNALTDESHGCYTPMYAACQNGHTEVVAALVDAGALTPFNISSDFRGPRPSDLLNAACENGHTTVASCLLAAQGTPCDPTTHDLTIDERGRHPLLNACAHGHTELVHVLLNHGVSVNQQGSEGYMPLHTAAQGGHAATLRTLLAAGAAANGSRDGGHGALFGACAAGHFDCASMLLAAGASTEQTGEGGAMCMWIACESNHLRIVQLLSSYGAARRGLHWNAYHIAEHLNYEALLAWLQMSTHWSTPLHHVTTSVVDAERARTLLRAGADIDDKGRDLLGPDLFSCPGQASPLLLAREYMSRAANGAAESSAARLVVQAGEPWSPQTHALFPAWARERAISLLRIGFLLVKGSDRVGLLDLWIDRVMPFDICREPLDVHAHDDADRVGRRRQSERQQWEVAAATFDAHLSGVALAGGMEQLI